MSLAYVLPPRLEWTVDDLDELPPDFRYELVNGRLIVPSPTAFHQNVCSKVLVALEVGCPADYFVAIDLSLEVDLRSQPRPDVVVIQIEDAHQSPVPVAGALLVVEIISPDSTFRDMYDKAKVYARAGVPTYWVIDPLHDKFTLTEMYLGEDGTYEVNAHTSDVFTTDRPWPVTIDLPALTARRAEVLDRAKP